MVGIPVLAGQVTNGLYKSDAAAAQIDSFVGIFWAIPKDGPAVILLDHRCLLEEAEPYGSMLTCPHGHHEVWEQAPERGRPAGRRRIANCGEPIRGMATR